MGFTLLDLGLEDFDVHMESSGSADFSGKVESGVCGVLRSCFCALRGYSGLGFVAGFWVRVRYEAAEARGLEGRFLI